MLLKAFPQGPTIPRLNRFLFKKSRTLTEEFNRIDGRLENLERALNDQIGEDVRLINQHLNDLHTVNREIAKLEISNPGSALDLRDQRQAMLESLSELIEFTPVEQSGNQGQISIYLNTGIGTPHAILDPTRNVESIGLNSDGRISLANDGGTTFQIGAGSLQALLQIRDQNLGDLRDNINQLVNSIVVEVNDPYSATGNNFFDPMGVTAASFTLDDTLNFSTLLATTSGFSGANELAKTIADLAGKEIPALEGNTLSQYSSRLITDLAQEIQDRQNRLNVQESVRELIQARRDEVSGISLDEEISHLLLFQKAFQASSRVFNVLDDMLNTLVNQLGR